MRVVLITGKGGVGKSTVAAATASRCAHLGAKTLVVSTDAAHSLGDVFGADIGHEPTEIGQALWAQQISARHQVESSWAEIRNYLAELLGWAGASDLSTDELLVVPGMQEVFALENILEQAESGRFDRIVVDCAPTAETLRLLELPEVLEWYVERVFPSHRRLAKLTRPVLSRTTSMPLADEAVFDAFVRFMDRLKSVRTLLSDSGITSMRLVVTPERIVVEEARRLYAHLCLFDYAVDSVVINRILPSTEVGTPLLDGWQKRQSSVIADLPSLFNGLDVRRAALRTDEPIGVDALNELGTELFGDIDPLRGATNQSPIRYSEADDRLHLTVRLPSFRQDEIDIQRSDGDLVITAGSERRAIRLADTVSERATIGARYDGTDLVVIFESVNR